EASRWGLLLLAFWSCLRHRTASSATIAQHSGFGQMPQDLRQMAEPLNALCHLAQLEFLDLAGAGLWDVGEHHVARTLVGGEVLLAPGHEIVRGNLGARLELDEGARRLAPLLVLLGHDCRRLHGGMLVERILDLDRRDVLAARDDDVLRAVLELDVAVCMP